MIRRGCERSAVFTLMGGWKRNEFAEENVDYWAFTINGEWGGQATQDFKLTARFVKKLSMKGSGARAEEAVEEIKEGIEDWLRDNKGSRGYEIPDNTRFEYMG